MYNMYVGSMSVHCITLCTIFARTSPFPNPPFNAILIEPHSPKAINLLTVEVENKRSWQVVTYLSVCVLAGFVSALKIIFLKLKQSILNIH